MFTAPTRGMRAAWALFYGFIMYCGMLVLVYPPLNGGPAYANKFTAVWGVLLLSAVIPAAASLLGRYKWEYAALPLVVAGVCIYTVAVWYMSWYSPDRAGQAAMFTALAIGLWRRLLDRRLLVILDRERQLLADEQRVAAQERKG